MENERKFFIVEFLIFYIGAPLFEKTEHGKLIFTNNRWLYVLGTKIEDFNALLDDIDFQLKNYATWSRQGTFAIEAKDINECLEILRDYVRCGHNCQEVNAYTHYSTFIDKKLRGFKPVLDITFENWPIKIEKVTMFPSCKYLNKEWKPRGIMVCGEIEEDPTELDLCPVCCGGSGVDEGECLPSAKLYLSTTNSIEQKMNVNGQFILKEIIWRS
ncbi:hypothetical protein M0Q50_04740 [bacterium]|jgi:hypothetical protein|nr:hypothetical protein [bacterium]